MAERRTHKMVEMSDGRELPGEPPYWIGAACGANSVTLQRLWPLVTCKRCLAKKRKNGESR